MQTYFDTLSVEQLSRLIRVVYDRMEGGEYHPYGINRRTMRIAHPHLLAVRDKAEAVLVDRVTAFGRTGDTW